MDKIIQVCSTVKTHEVCVVVVNTLGVQRNMHFSQDHFFEITCSDTWIRYMRNGGVIE